jgi:hypothetical protein
MSCKYTDGKLDRRSFLGRGMMTLGAASVAGPASPLFREQSPSPSERPEPPDWFTGDVHMHRSVNCDRSHAKHMLTPEQLLQMMKVNNLAVISVLADIGNGEGKYQAKDIPMITGRDNPVSTPDRIVHWGGEWHFDPEGVTFAQKAIGGHIVCLGLKHGRAFFSEYTYPVFAWVREQGGIAGFAHMQYLPYAFYPPPDGIPLSLDCCTPLEYPVEAALGTCSFVSEDVHGGDSAIQGYYKLLNCGLRLGFAGGTDYPCNGLDPLGSTLTYVRIPGGKLTYGKWIEGIAEGRTVLSRNAHNEFLELKVNGAAQPGDEIRLSQPGPVHVGVKWSAAQKDPATEMLGKIEVVQNGGAIRYKTDGVAPGKPVIFETTVEFRQSGWLAARRIFAWGGIGHETQTGAVYVVVDGAPIRANASDPRFFVAWIDNLIKRTSPGGPWSKYFPTQRSAVHERYRKARAIYLERAAEAERQVIKAG